MQDNLEQLVRVAHEASQEVTFRHLRGLGVAYRKIPWGAVRDPARSAVIASVKAILEAINKEVPE